MRAIAAPVSHADGGAPLTPMIDVIFQLLIFFLCTAAFDTPEQLLPASVSQQGAALAAAPDPLPREPVEVGVAGGAGAVTFAINGRPVADRAALRATLERLRPVAADAPLILDVADEVAVADLVDVYDLCRSLEFADVRFAVRR